MRELFTRHDTRESDTRKSPGTNVSDVQGLRAFLHVFQEEKERALSKEEVSRRCFPSRRRRQSRARFHARAM